MDGGRGRSNKASRFGVGAGLRAFGERKCGLDGGVLVWMRVGGGGGVMRSEAEEAVRVPFSGWDEEQALLSLVAPSGESMGGIV